MRIIISGTTNGIGYATLRELFKNGHELITVNRNIERAEEIKKEFEKEIKTEGSIKNFYADFSDLGSVQLVCQEIKSHISSVDVLINNAGLFCDSHQQTAQGLEMTLGVNYFAPVLLTRSLLPLLKDSGRGRIINLSSRAALFGKIRFKKLCSAKHPHGFPAYSASKLAVVLWTRSLAESVQGVDVIAVHPGEVASNIWTGDTFFMKMMAPIVRNKYQTIDVGAETSIYLAETDDVSKFNGCFVEKKDQIVPFNKRCSDDVTRDLLYSKTDDLFVKIGFS